MSVFDLREWLAAAESAGELQHVTGADAVLEIGAASQLNYRRKRPRALLFDEIAGHRPGQRVLTSSVSSPALMGMTLGLGTGLDDLALVDALRGKPAAWESGAAAHPAREVDSGPVMQNVLAKDDINFLRFPSPVWHEHDGGPYIGTGCAVVTVD
ncbi:MAG TPA: UbiD family decarboxylase domain-containing protein, partial [Streptosporangiaceae bacterium]|nr:UbiD family decarboxylase domain-containing protein [Streptosporangiaceae bacterium]